MPKKHERHYQKPAEPDVTAAAQTAYFFYSPGDVNTIKFFHRKPGAERSLSDDEIAEIKEKDYERLRQMVFFSTTRDCLRNSY